MSSMGFQTENIVEDTDFFARELNKLDWGMMSQERNNENAEGDDDMGWDGPPLFH